MKDGEKVIKEFTSNGYKYVLASPVLVVSKVELNNIEDPDLIITGQVLKIPA